MIEETGINEPIAKGILRTLQYFGLFRYPLLPAEIHRFHPLQCSLAETLTELENLANNGRVACSAEGFYSISANDNWTAERLSGNKKAMAILARSGRSTRIISSFPFVDAIAISGSLSKYHAGEDADIDYFIITTTNRLWIARSLLHLFKKLTFLTGSQHYFCMNYFIDASALEIADKNRYTAIELATVIPVYNKCLIEALINCNSWIRGYLPNLAPSLNQAYLITSGKAPLKWFFERLIDHCRPEHLNRFLMRFTDRKWRRKWSRKGFPMEDYNQSFLTLPNVSKNHPANFQKRVLVAMETNTEIPRT